MSRPALVSRALLAGALSASIINPALAEDDLSDSEDRRTIVVTGERDGDANPNANPNAPYKVENSANSKFTEPLRDTPKSITVIPKERGYRRDQLSRGGPLDSRRDPGHR